MTTPRHVLQGLRQRSLTHPQDVAAHLVFADALLSDGDELGEYISAAVLHGDVDPSPEVHLRLLGRLNGMMDGWDLEYGFLRTVLLSPMRVQVFRSLIGLGEWEGVTRLALPRRSGKRARAMPAQDVLELVSHPVCGQLQRLDNLEFEPFVALCDADRTFLQLEVRVPQWGVNTPLKTGSLHVVELTLRGDYLAAAVGWLRTWGRTVFDRVVSLHTDVIGARGLDLVTNRPGAALHQVISPDWNATREGKGWHFDLSTVGVHSPASVQAGEVRDLMRKQLTPVASRFTIRVPDFNEHELQRFRAAAQGVAVEFREKSLPPMPVFVGDWDAPF